MWFQDFANSLLLELQLPNKPLPRQKQTAETFSDTPLPGVNLFYLFRSSNQYTINTVIQMCLSKNLTFLSFLAYSK